jgi:hypothetical protein
MSLDTCSLENLLRFGEKPKYHLAQEVLLGKPHEGGMIRWLTSPLLVALYTCLLFLAHAQPQSRDQAPKKDSTVKQQGTAMTGCVDEQDSHYVLVDARDLKPIASLEADGFPAEGFAKHMGHRVTVRGISTTGGTIPLMKVRSIEAISDSCQLQLQPQ